MEFIVDFKQAIFQDLESFFSTLQVEENHINFVLQTFNCKFATYEKPPAKYKVSDNNKILDNLVNANVPIDVITVE